MTPEEKRQKRREYLAEWHKQNPDKAREYKEKYWRQTLKRKKRNPLSPEEKRQKRRESHAEWRKRNPEKIRAWGQKYARECREKINAAERKRYAENPEKYREAGRKWKEQNPEAYRQYLRKSYAEHRDELLPEARERSRQWRKDNPERMLQQARDWYAKNPERARLKALEEYHKRRAENPEKLREQQRKYRAENPHAVLNDNHRRRARYEGSFTKEDIERLFTVQEGKCAACTRVLETKGRNKYHIDHIVPLKPRKGFPAGTNDPSNLQLLCMPCNRSKNNLDPSQWAERLKRRSPSRPHLNS